MRSRNPDPRVAGGRLTIDLDAPCANYRCLREQAGRRGSPAWSRRMPTASASKVAPVLWAEGCRVFFVALPEEGAALRAVLPDAYIFVLAGLFEAGSAESTGNSDLLPVSIRNRDVALGGAWLGRRRAAPLRDPCRHGHEPAGPDAEEASPLPATTR
jgi:alanine racemase